MVGFRGVCISSALRTEAEIGDWGWKWRVGLWLLRLVAMGRVKHQEPEEAPETEATTPERSYHELVANVNAIARPLASRKLTRKLYKCIKKGACDRGGGEPFPGGLWWAPVSSFAASWGEVFLKALAFYFVASKFKQIRRGVKEVQKFINKGEKGITVLAGDTLPIDVYCHIPIMCEDRSLPYVYIPSKTDLGAAAGSKRPTCVIMIKAHEDYQAAYNECLEEVEALPLPL
uniref:NHP2 ribonucleoprotein n=1 Tax=Laticauda laticaudata TaxID=8630 RepID=A0A8C5S029_LATLA